MSTRAALIFPNANGTFTTIYCHYDGMSARMMPALRAHDPEDIRQAGELRSLSEVQIEGYPSPRHFPPAKTAVFPSWASHAYLLTDGAWSHCADQTDLDILLDNITA